ncbi:MAG: hypothetical protein IJC46_08780, partial [Clostridia bacterium]|nr:hypothetical protein [Clostridia bacterium]
MRILIGIFLLSAEMTAQRITSAIGIISTNSALFFRECKTDPPAIERDYFGYIPQSSNNPP